ncbi:MAG: acyltransferase [Butyrivibrio sp.]|nr:acyltransferase [Butyrivibrio sp.]
MIFLNGRCMKKSGRSIVLDKVKALACIFIILIHCKFPGLLGDLCEAFARFGVPMFFAISGKFLLSENDVSTTQIRTRLKKKIVSLVKIIIPIWLFYTVYSLFYSLTCGYTVSRWASEKYNLFELSRLILFNSGKFIYDFTYAFDHLWFVFALLYVYALVFIFAKVVRKWSFPLFILLSALLYILELLQTYYPIRPFDISVSTWYVVRNWLFVGVPFTMLGVWARDNLYKCTLLCNVKSGVLFVVLGVISTIAEFKIWGNKEVYLGSLFVVVGALILSEVVHSEKQDIFSFVGDKLSSFIYYMHVFVISLFGWFIDRINPELYGNALFMYMRPLVVILLTIAISLLMNWIWYNTMERKAA